MKNEFVSLIMLSVILFVGCFSKPKFIDEMEYRKGENTVIVSFLKPCRIYNVTIYEGNKYFLTRDYKNDDYLEFIEINKEGYGLIFHTNKRYDIGVDTNRGLFMGEFKIVDKTDVEAVKEVDFSDSNIEIIKVKTVFELLEEDNEMPNYDLPEGARSGDRCYFRINKKV